MIKLRYSLFSDGSFLTAFSDVFSRSFDPVTNEKAYALAIAIQTAAKAYRDLVDRALHMRGRIDTHTGAWTISGTSEHVIRSYYQYMDELHKTEFEIPIDAPITITRVGIPITAAVILRDVINVEWVSK